MCLMNQQPISGYNSPCGQCPEYLNTCLPIVISGYLWGECDQCYCEFCSYYEECTTPGLTLACQSEQE